MVNKMLHGFWLFKTGKVEHKFYEDTEKFRK